MGYVVDPGFLNQTTAFHLSWQDTAGIQMVTAGLRAWLPKRTAAIPSRLPGAELNQRQTTQASQERQHLFPS